ncbi:hypothetical protein D9757_013063 [Collybiopsis confluens]|uniref:Tyr recombinase domain-containing protein n=1 Tax=Collybiopsis confluens TaxID=2823264 RepID=A0A8H5G364_9AGAR|nr:hypothetical protein D9757_013063 [Collybiopsis confluens]
MFRFGSRTDCDPHSGRNTKDESVAYCQRSTILVLGYPTLMLSQVPSHWYETHAGVSPQVAFFLWHGLAASTRKTYSTGQKSYIDFARLHPKLLESPGQFLPAPVAVLKEWIVYLGMCSLQPKTIKAYLSSVRSLHVDTGLSFDACESVTLQRIIRGIKCYYGDKGRNPKLPITLDILRAITAPPLSGDLNHIPNAIFDAAAKLAWSALFRTGEFALGDQDAFDPAVHLTRDSIQFIPSVANPTHVRVSLPSSKTDPFCRGVTLVIAAVPHLSTCPVSALKHLFSIHPLSAKSPLFAGPDGLPLRRSAFISTLKQRIAATGMDAARFSGHSFRRGAASSAAAAGYSDYEIQRLLGRWRSDAYKLYLDVAVDRMLHLSACLHGVSAPAQRPGPLDLPFASVVA